MIKLYVKTGCPYCMATLAKVDELGVKINEQNISDPQILAELMEKGGKRQVPYMIDEDQNVSMYESGDIIDHLEMHYGKGNATESSNQGDISTGGVCPVS